MEGQCSVPAVGSVDAGVAPYLPYVVVDADGREVVPVSAYLCQGTSGLPCGRTADLLAGGQVMSVPTVGLSPGGSGQRRHSLSCGGLGEAEAGALGEDEVGVMQQPKARGFAESWKG